MPKETPASEQSATQNEKEPGATPIQTAGESSPEQLGSGGIKALQAERARAEEAERALKQFAALGLTVDQIKELADKERSTPSVEDIRDQARREAESAVAEKLAAGARAAEVRAQAAELGFHNPADALALIPAEKLAEVKVDDNGFADSEAVKEILTALAKSRDYLVRPATATYRGAGIGASGAAGMNTEPGLPRLRAAYQNTQ